MVMAKKESQMVDQIAGVLEKRSGKAVSEKVLIGRNTIGTSRRDIAMWVKGAMERMDSLVPEEDRVAVMEECGRKCCSINKGVVVKFRKRRSKCDSMDSFLESETKKPMRGMKVSKEGNEIHFYYTPRSFGKGMRCYCGLVGGLPPEETMSRTYCMCSVGFVKTLWESVLEKPVQVGLVRSALTGSDECEFKITY